MAQHLEPLKINGTTVWIEADDVTLPARSRAASADDPTALTAATESSALTDGLLKVDLRRTLAAVLGPVYDAVAAVEPKEVSVELSLGFKGEVGVFVAKSEGNAALKITAKWTFDKPGKPAGAA